MTISKVMWHGAHPSMPTGYAQVARTFIPRLGKHFGEDNVAVSCLAGVNAFASTWTHPDSGQSFRVYPHTAYEQLGQDVVRGHYHTFDAGLIFTMTCTWVFNAAAWRDMRTIHITPIDTAEDMSVKDYDVIVNSGGTPAAVTRHGERLMRARGLEPLYLPHGIDTNVFRPPKNRQKLRRAMGIDHMFVVAINAGNYERDRKAWWEQLAGFARFHERHPKSLLMIHSQMYLPGGFKLPAMLAKLGIADAVLWSDQYQLMTGGTTDQALAGWCGAADVGLLATKGEGFGLPTVEFQACGTPVIGPSWAAGPETIGAGWLVDGQSNWNDHHETIWYTPYIDSIADKLEEAYTGAQDRRGAAREAALKWDADTVWAEHWEPALAALTGEVPRET